MNPQVLRQYTLSPRSPCVSLIGPSGSKYADRDTILPAVCVCPGLWCDLRYTSNSTTLLLGVCTRSLSLLTHTARFLHPFSPASQLTLPLAVSLSFSVLSDTCPETPVARITQALSTKLSTWKDRRRIDVPDDAAALSTLFTVRPIS